jgi:hypothetical protein
MGGPQLGPSIEQVRLEAVAGARPKQAPWRVSPALTAAAGVAPTSAERCAAPRWQRESAWPTHETDEQVVERELERFQGGTCYGTPSSKLDLVVWGRPDSAQVDLHNRGQVEEVAAPPVQQNVLEHVPVHFEIGLQRPDEVGDPAERELEHDVDIVRCSWLALQRARETPSDEVASADAFDGPRHAQSNIDDIGDSRVWCHHTASGGISPKSRSAMGLP